MSFFFNEIIATNEKVFETNEKLDVLTSTVENLGGDTEVNSALVDEIVTVYNTSANTTVKINPKKISGFDLPQLALGKYAGDSNQGLESVAIGYFAGYENQQGTVAIGSTAGRFNQAAGGIAIGINAGNETQGVNCVAIGTDAGLNNQGENSIAIGTNAGSNNQAANSIAINASGGSINPATSGLFIKPIAATSSTKPSLVYDTTTSEISYDSSKTFVIDHPLDQNKYLIHACLEGPEAGVYYRGKGVITNNESVIIELPNYVSKLATNFTVNITKIYSGKVDPHNYEVSEVENNLFTVYGKNGSFNWIVYAERKPIEVEVDKTLVKLSNFGPYTYLEKL